MNVKERLKAYLSESKISQSRFEQSIGLGNGYVNNIVKSISPKVEERIALHYPDLNTGWLLTGKGEMINKSESSNKLTAQRDMDFSAIVESNSKLANAVDTIAESNRIMAITSQQMVGINERITETNSRLIEQLIDTLNQIEKKLDKGGGVEAVENVAPKEAQG